MLNSISSLAQWLDYITNINPKSVDLGLDRIKKVAAQIAIKLPQYNIVVGGTNGKGSTICLLNQAFSQLGYTTSSYTSPHIKHYNERFILNGQEALDQEITTAFHIINTKRNNISLTYFEFTTLAAMLIFSQSEIDIGLWEIGLGGRLDAVNIINADLAIITSLDIDHQEYLGDTLEEIAAEKAGILRENQDAIFGGTKPPLSLLKQAQKLKTKLTSCQQDFNYKIQPTTWEWSGRSKQGEKIILSDLPLPHLAISSAAIMIQTLNLMDILDTNIVRATCSRAKLIARMQYLNLQQPSILDIAHNPAAAEHLTLQLQKKHPQTKYHTIISILKDKDTQGILNSLAAITSHWYFVTNKNNERGQSAHQIATKFNQQLRIPYSLHESFKDAYHLACNNIACNNIPPEQKMPLLQIDEVQGNRTADALSTCKTKIRSVYRIHENSKEHLTPQNSICTSPKILITGSFYIVGAALTHMSSDPCV